MLRKRCPLRPPPPPSSCSSASWAAGGECAREAPCSSPPSPPPPSWSSGQTHPSSACSGPSLRLLDDLLSAVLQLGALLSRAFLSLYTLSPSVPLLALIVVFFVCMSIAWRWWSSSRLIADSGAVRATLLMCSSKGKQGGKGSGTSRPIASSARSPRARPGPALVQVGVVVVILLVHPGIFLVFLLVLRHLYL